MIKLNQQLLAPLYAMAEDVKDRYKMIEKEIV